MRQNLDSDAALFHRALNGDPDAFPRLFRKHSPILLKWLRAELQDPDAAADLLSETFAAAWASRLSYADPGGGELLPWLYGIARNLTSQYRRRGTLDSRARRSIGMSVREYETTPFGPEERLMRGELDAELEGALRALPEPQRLALELRIVSDLSYETVGEHLAVTSGAARIRVHRALRTLREALNKGGNL